MSETGVLLVNLGSPDSTSTSDVRKYLREFLMDERVLDSPYLMRWMVVHLMILPKRPHESAEAYRAIWTPDGSPLIVTTRALRDELAARLQIPIEDAMRYRNPSVRNAVKKLVDQGVKRIVLVPLFPHYAMSSYETAVEKVRSEVARLPQQVALEVVDPYFDRPGYVDALAAVAQPWLDGEYDHLLFSFHGVPERHLVKSDPTGKHCLQSDECCAGEHPAHRTCYRAQCLKTAESFVARTGLQPDRYSVAFQSRLGRDPWLRPYADQELERLARQGVRRILVICPSFVSDCLETLEEIGIRGRETFEEAGGEDLQLISCLNQHPAWLREMEDMVRQHL